MKAPPSGIGTKRMILVGGGRGRAFGSPMTSFRAKVCALIKIRFVGCLWNRAPVQQVVAGHEEDNLSIVVLLVTDLRRLRHSIDATK